MSSVLRIGLIAAGVIVCVSFAFAASRSAGQAPNIVFVLSDDHRYDALGIIDPSLNTPNLDFLAENGVHYPNAFVTTSLCSPSRASILTGQYMHNHGVVDNNKPIKAGLKLFPEYLQTAGYETAFVGKWHMGGEVDDPQPGFDYWLSFKGQGDYFPKERDGRVSEFNINGKRVPQKGYITDELTDYALSWLKGERDKKKPFFLYLSHKAVHAPFTPAKRHEGIYGDLEISTPSTMDDFTTTADNKPMWVQNQRNSWHGVDFPYHEDLDVTEYKRNYFKALTAVDESVGRVIEHLRQSGELDNTIIVYMGDNGFMFGEHGLIDKRNAYEESMRVPLIAFAPGRLPEAETIESLVANIDIAPTLLDFAGIDEAPSQFEGESFVSLSRGEVDASSWRKELLYEYYWEYNYPHTPTTFALRGDRFKFVTYHGVWDREELYDLQADPQEKVNLINDGRYDDVRVSMRHRLFEMLQHNGGRHAVPYNARTSVGAVLRSDAGAKGAQFPGEWMREGTPCDRIAIIVRDGKKRRERFERDCGKAP